MEFPDGAAWTQLAPATSPSARYDFAMANIKGAIYIFGGEGSAGSLDDTWKFDGSNWTQITPSTSPSARYDMGMTTLGNQAILFGGYDGSYLGDTWTFDGANWTKLNPATSLMVSFEH